MTAGAEAVTGLGGAGLRACRKRQAGKDCRD